MAGMAAKAALAHVSVGCNAAAGAFSGRQGLRSPLETHLQAPDASGASSDGVVAAFGARNAVALLSKRGAGAPRVTATLQHRLPTAESTRVTSVCLFSSAAGGEAALFVLAGDSEGRVFLWRGADAGGDWQLALLSSSADAGAALPPVSVAAVAMAETRDRWICVAAFSDGTTAAFTQSKCAEASDAWAVAAVRSGPRMIMESLDATVIATVGGEGAGQGSETVLVAAGGVDRKVHLFELADGAGELTPLIALFGHHDWVRSVAFQLPRYKLDGAAGRVTLASGSQDQRIRLWDIRVAVRAPSSTAGDDLAVHSAADSTAHGQNLSYAVRFDALLLGHEDWVTSLQWTSLPSDNEGRSAALVSSSMDNTLIVWQCREEGGSWAPAHIVGTVDGNGLLAVAMLPSDDKSGAGGRMDILALNLMGHIERWRQQHGSASLFLPAASVNGHCGAVTDLSWSASGELLMSVSLDQTTRVLARSASDWHEISRAQVHGYDINCGCFIQRPEQADDGDSLVGDRIVSGADEKILRVFDAPHQVYKTAAALRAAVGDGANATTGQGADGRVNSVRHAFLPELSLTNKASTNDRNGSDDSTRQGYVSLIDDGSDSAAVVPVGSTLYRKTLWPEQRKLYGHGNELLCVTSNQSGTRVASACKSREERFAAVWLWDTSDWSAAQEPLEGHKSSVVQLAFSPDDQSLLSVSKDRQFCVYSRQDDGKFALEDRQKAHKRIIWSCSWSPDSRVFALGSRDQTFSLWRRTPGQSSFTRALAIQESDPVTAVAFAPCAFGSHLLAVGLESGLCRLYAVTTADEVSCVSVGSVPLEDSPASSISRLSWSPSGAAGPEGEVSQRLTLAAGSSDHSVRIYNITWRNPSG